MDLPDIPELSVSGGDGSTRRRGRQQRDAVQNRYVIKLIISAMKLQNNTVYFIHGLRQFLG